jgi:hypothetical protein
MKEESTEPNGDDNYIKHRIVSWYGEHKMLAKLLILGFLILSVSGAYLHLSQAECEDITLNLSWNATDIYEIEGEPAVHCHEDEAMQLIAEVSTVRLGVLKVIAKPESGRPVWLTMTKENTSSWKKGEIQVYFQSITDQTSLTTHPIWVKAQEDQDNLTRHCIIVEAFFVNEDCSKTKHAYIDVSEGSIPVPIPPPNDLERLIKWIEENPFVAILIVICIVGIFLVIGKGKKKTFKI